MNVDSEVAVSHVRDERGGVVGQVLCSILAVLGAVATFAVVRIAIDRIRGGGDPGVLTVAIVPGLFTLTFLALAVLSGAQRRQDKALAKRQALHPDAPWLWADDWREGRITSVSSRKTAVLVAAFAGFWNTFVIAGALVAWRSGPSMETGYWLFLATFGLVGLALIAGAVYLALQTSRRSSDTTLWQDEVTLRTSPTGVPPVAFRIPFDLPPRDARYVEVAIEGGTTYWIVAGSSSGTEETKWLAGEVNRAVERFRNATTPVGR